MPPRHESDDDDEFNHLKDSYTNNNNINNNAPKRVTNLPYDEAVDVDAASDSMVSSEDNDDDYDQRMQARNRMNHIDDDAEDDEDDDDDDEAQLEQFGDGNRAPTERLPQQPYKTAVKLPAKPAALHDSSPKSMSFSSSNPSLPAPLSFDSLVVPPEIQQLFDYIGRHTPETITLPTPFAPFIPDFIPAIGEIDAFLKPAHPQQNVMKETDEAENMCGLTVLDEPATRQTDPSVLEIALKAAGKVRSGYTAVRKIENAQKHPKRIGKWIENMTELRKNAPLASTTQSYRYTQKMPDVDRLLQCWSEGWTQEAAEEFRYIYEYVNRAVSADKGSQGNSIDIGTSELLRIICALCDIPVGDRLVDSAHMLFTMVGEFQANAHFSAS